MNNLYLNSNYRMKSFAIILLVLFCNRTIAQQDNENIKKTIYLFLRESKPIILLSVGILWNLRVFIIQSSKIKIDRPYYKRKRFQIFCSR